MFYSDQFDGVFNFLKWNLIRWPPEETHEFLIIKENLLDIHIDRGPSLYTCCDKLGIDSAVQLKLTKNTEHQSQSESSTWSPWRPPGSSLLLTRHLVLMEASSLLFTRHLVLVPSSTIIGAKCTSLSRWTGPQQYNWLDTTAPFVGNNGYTVRYPCNSAHYITAKYSLYMSPSRFQYPIFPPVVQWVWEGDQVTRSPDLFQ